MAPKNGPQQTSQVISGLNTEVREVIRDLLKVTQLKSNEDRASSLTPFLYSI